METTITKRRSQRLFLQVRVVVEGTLPDSTALREETHTIVVNAHAALVELSAMLDAGQRVTLRNEVSGDKSQCTVKLVTPTGTGKFNTAFEFNRPNPDFWHVSFPPEDWTSRPPDPKKG